MERESLEEGAPLLVGRQKDETFGIGDSEAEIEIDSSVTPVLFLSAFVVICGNLAFGCAEGYSSPAQFGIMEDLGVSSAEYSLFASLPTIGAMVGASVTGKIADLIGRRATLWCTQVLCFMGWLAIAFAKDVWWLDIGRISYGLGVGLFTFVVPTYITEITPRNLRGTIYAMTQLMTCCGISLMYFIGTLVNWRTLALIGSIPCFVPLVGLFFVPESPRWLAKIGRGKELEASLRRLRGQTADVSLEAAYIRNYTETFQQHSEHRFLHLFQRRYAHALIVAVGLVMFQQLGGTTAIVSYASYIFVSAGFSSNVGSIGVAIVQIPATVFSIVLVDKSGRRPVLMVGAAGMCLSCILVGLSFFLQDLNQWKGISPILVCIGIMAYIVFFSGGMAAIPLLLMSEMFPINVKGSAGSLMILVNCACAWISTYTFNFMMEWSSTATFFIFSIICGLALVFTVKLVPETKGRTLEEVQASITHFL